VVKGLVFITPGICVEAFGDAFHICNLRTCCPLGIRGEKENKEAAGLFQNAHPSRPFTFGFALVGKDIVFRFII
jgi:hypothetical protein